MVSGIVAVAVVAAATVVALREYSDHDHWEEDFEDLEA